MRPCKHCGQPFVVHQANDRYCPPCHRDELRRMTPPPPPVWLPVWLRNLQAKELSPGRAA